MVSFSIVIPVYNAAATIESTLKSCLNQSLSAKEIIVVDDGSQDETVKVLQPYKEKIILIQRDANQGVSAARNVGWERASGDYVAFLDSDDQWHTDKLKIITEFLSNNDEEVKIIAHPYCLNQFPVIDQNNLTCKKYAFSHFLIKNHVQTSCLIVDRNLNCRFDEQMSYCEDHDLLLRITYQHDCCFLSLPLTLLNRPQLSKGGLSSNQWKMRKGELLAFYKLKNLNKALIALIPFLFSFSLLKHLRNKVLKP